MEYNSRKGKLKHLGTSSEDICYKPMKWRHQRNKKASLHRRVDVKKQQRDVPVKKEWHDARTYQTSYF